MRKVSIPKGNGKYRTLYIPSDDEKAKLQALVPELARIERRQAYTLDVDNVAHAFIRGRSPATCAHRHIGFQTTVSMDLESWFDSISAESLREHTPLSDEMIAAVTIDGYLRQGLPTSPHVANIIGAVFDNWLLLQLKSFLDVNDLPFVYTRYADDLVVSFRGLIHNTNDPYVVEAVRHFVLLVADRLGWKIAEHKTHVQRASAGRRIIVGISVGETDIRATRKSRRRLRSAVHKNNDKQIAGLTEWCACKLPKSMRVSRKLVGVRPTIVTHDQTPKAVQTDTISHGTRRLVIPKEDTNAPAS